MKIFIRSYDKEGNFTESPVASLSLAKASKQVGEKIHICRHDEKQSCSLE